MSRSEIIRMGIRRLSAEILTEQAPGSSLDALLGSLDGAEDVPSDLAARHDEYLYGNPEEE